MIKSLQYHMNKEQMPTMEENNTGYCAWSHDPTAPGSTAFAVLCKDKHLPFYVLPGYSGQYYQELIKSVG